jgi:hypothetical protein
MTILFALNALAGLLIVASAAYSVKLAWHPTRCQHSGCKSEGMECVISWEGETFYYCPDHAGQNGFCYLCGDFWGGIESFEFIHPDICDNCWDQIRDDDSEYYRDDDDPYDDYGYYDFNHYDEAGYPTLSYGVSDNVDGLPV